MSRWFRLLFLFFLLTAFASAQSIGVLSISGVVRIENGAVIAGAQIDLFVGGVKSKSTTTDNQGNFRFAQL